LAIAGNSANFSAGCADHYCHVGVAEKRKITAPWGFDDVPGMIAIPPGH
jgi:hypothetical protein